MANETIKKFKTPLSDLPAVNSETQGYSLRYRIVSDDKNRISHWSPIYLIDPDFTYVPGIIQFNKAGNIASVVWDSVTVNKVDGANTYFIKKESQYDFWVRWDQGGGNGDWLYKERLSTTSLSLPIPTTYTVNGVVQGSAPNRMSIEIYIPGYPIERSDGAAGTPFLKVYRLLNQTV
jgi:hypothetical protein